MDKHIRNEIFHLAKRKFGEHSQVVAGAEEFSEAAAALCRHANGKVREVETVLTELADAEIMCEQMRLYFDGAAIDAEKDRKMTRLARMLGLKIELLVDTWIWECSCGHKNTYGRDSCANCSQQRIPIHSPNEVQIRPGSPS